MINLLGIGLDYLMLKKEKVRGDVRVRQLDYAKKLGFYHLVVFSPHLLNLQREQWSNNLIVYPTNSYNKGRFLLDAFNIARGIFKTNKIELITTEDPFTTGFIGYCLKKRYKIPLNIQTHVDFCNNQYWMRQRKFNIFLNFLGKFILKQADTIRVGTDYEKRKIVKLGIKEERINVIPVNLDLSKFIAADSVKIKAEIKAKGYDQIIVFTGRLVQQKDIPTLLRAFKEVLVKKSKSILVVIGKGPLERELKDFTVELGIGENVLFTGSIEHNLIPQYLAAADVYVITSLFEGTCISMAEAMATCTPVVATRFAGAIDLIKDSENGFVINQRDYSAIADKILFLLDNPDKAREMGIKGQVIVKKLFSNNQNIDKIIDLWKKTALLSR